MTLLKFPIKRNSLDCILEILPAYNYGESIFHDNTGVTCLDFSEFCQVTLSPNSA